MMSQIPAYVDAVLSEWQTIAFVAYDGFERLGRGAVGISQKGNTTELLYGECDFFVKQKNDQVLRMIQDYDPEWEFITFFDTSDGNTRTLRVRTPEGGQHPKSVWFFEMLRRTADEPESMPEHLPAWFLEALEKLEKAKKTPKA